MLILSDFVDFESSVEYFNNYKLVMSQYIVQKPPPPWHPQIESPTPWQRKACKGPGVPGNVGWVPVSLIPALFLFNHLKKKVRVFPCIVAVILLHNHYCITHTAFDVFFSMNLCEKYVNQF